MSSNRYATALRINLGFSRWLALLVVCSHGVALALIMLLPVPWWLRLGLVILVIISCRRQCRRHVLRCDPRTITALEWRADDSWWLTAHNGVVVNPSLEADSYIHPLLVILNFSCAGGSLSVVLFRDSIDHEHFRRLRLRLGTARLVS